MKLGNANEHAYEECELEYERVLAELGEKMGCPPNQRKSNIAVADEVEQLLKLFWLKQSFRLNLISLSIFLQKQGITDPKGSNSSSDLINHEEREISRNIF